ncbi:nuclear cap-binding protein subunit 3 [Diabrotica virgifera virgifera]|uniref:Nuclear cap-binding protein subunit 3 n=1 Tax=Diabrotica virgifera virgifera TaxID=50390 RepID=A0ABM5IBI3_DIAVI|nr:nuclear cap-binding protein subunit 3 [Diabrotica virgifera virgifera]
MEIENERPNIRIEIPNQQMDVDESENEDGEIVDDDQQEIQMQQSLPASVFTTGINIFDEEEHKKRVERAKRFALKPEEIHHFTDADHEELRESLGITDDNENLIRFDTVHLLGTKDMLIEDILDYFAKYAPTEIECVDEQSVNVKWVENITAARAMFYTSKAVKGMPVRHCNQVLVKDFLDGEEPEEEHGQSILLKNRQVELSVDGVIVPNTAKDKFKNAVDITEITIPIPPGYWRLGDKHPKAKCLLLRYAMKTDKKPYKIEYLAKYYKRMGTTKNLSDPKQKGGIFDRNKDLPRGKNPWGNLARNWDKDAKFRETTPTSGETVEIKNSSLATRLGVKTRADSENEVEIVEEETTVKKPKGRAMRMRMYADEEEERIKIRKAIQKLKNQTEQLKKEPKDLRTILSINNYREPIEVIDLVEDDLGRKLKNRSRQIVFAIDRDPVELRRDRKENIKSDVRSVLNRRRGRSRSPYEHRRGEHSQRHRARSPLRREESPVRRRSPLHRRHATPERTVRYNRYSSRYQEYDHSDQDDADGKPRSKVAVVIKKQKQPTVASTIWSKTQESDSEESSSSEEESSNSEESESGSSSEESESESEESDSGSSSSEEEETPKTRKIARPGFDYNAVGTMKPPSTLRITMANDRYRRD